MKTIGEILKEARADKNLSLKNLESATKIKSSFIDLIEKENWSALPPFPIVLGFVKSLAVALNLDSNMAVAVLKRDYPPTKLRILPKPDVKSKIVWSPKLTFVLGVVFVFAIIGTYLLSQYIHFISPPKLIVDSPKDGQVIAGKSVSVYGSTDSDAKIVINNQPIIVGEDGNFNYNLEIVAETKEIKITASSRSGKITEVVRKIEIQGN